MRSTRKVLAFLTTSLLFVSLPAYAAAVQYTFSAPVAFEIRGDQLAAPQQRLFDEGEEISGSFEYDNAIVDGIAVPGFGTFFSALSNVSGSIGNNSFFDAEGVVGVGNDSFDDPNRPDLVDLLILSTTGDGTDSPLTGFQVVNGLSFFELVSVRFFWIETDQDLIDDNLPETLPSGIGIARIALDFVDLENPANTHTVFAESLSITTVPVPAAVWLMLGGLGTLGAFGRRAS